jgi:hypothetical protein
VWNIACGRETLREYAVSHDAEFMLFLDSDMTYDPMMVNTLKAVSNGYDVVYSGYTLRNGENWGYGTGLLMLNRKAFSLIPIVCREFKNGNALYEDDLLDMAFFQHRIRVKKGIFVANRHYSRRDSFLAIAPQRVTPFRELANALFPRYLILRLSILLKRHIALELHILLSKHVWDRRNAKKSTCPGIDISVRTRALAALNGREQRRPNSG